MAAPSQFLCAALSCIFQCFTLSCASLPLLPPVTCAQVRQQQCLLFQRHVQAALHSSLRPLAAAFDNGPQSLPFVVLVVLVVHRRRSSLRFATRPEGRSSATPKWQTSSSTAAEDCSGTVALQTKQQTGSVRTGDDNTSNNNSRQASGGGNEAIHLAWLLSVLTEARTVVRANLPHHNPTTIGLISETRLCVPVARVRGHGALLVACQRERK